MCGAFERKENDFWELKNIIFTYRIVSNKRSPSNKRPLTYFQIKLDKMPKFLYGVSL